MSRSFDSKPAFSLHPANRRIPFIRLFLGFLVSGFPFDLVLQSRGQRGSERARSLEMGVCELRGGTAGGRDRGERFESFPKRGKTWILASCKGREEIFQVDFVCRKKIGRG